MQMSNDVGSYILVTVQEIFSAFSTCILFKNQKISSIFWLRTPEFSTNRQVWFPTNKKCIEISSFRDLRVVYERLNIPEKQL